MNSRKSLCRFAEAAPVALDQLEEDVAPLVGGETRIEPVVGSVGFVESTEDLDRSIHAESVPRGFIARTGPDETAFET